MGCASSKQHRPVCRNCRAPITRSYSMHVHHPPQSDDDSYHVVALKSSTLGYLQLDQSKEVCCANTTDIVQVRPVLGVGPVLGSVHTELGEPVSKDENEFAVGIIDAKTWSKMIEEKIPKFVPRTPVTTPPGEPETINAWELMEGLDDTSPLRPKFTTNHIRSFSFHVNPNSFAVEDNNTSDSNSNSNSNSNSVFSSNDMSVVSELNSEVTTKELDLEPSKDGSDDISSDITTKTSLHNGKNNSPPRGKEKLVLYFTSLRGVRKTYEDCCHVRHLLKATGVRVDERDVSMHSGFKEELKELLGGFISGLPKVFIGKKCVGGAMEIRRLHEDGLLERAVEGCEMAGGDSGGCGGGVACEACGDIRFIPCETCSGSCKIYYEDECDDTDYDEEEEKEEGDYGFQRCPDCNENGLIRCPICCD